MDRTKPQGALACKSRAEMPDLPKHIENLSYRAEHFEHRSARRHVPNDGINYRFERRRSGSGGGDPLIRESPQDTCPTVRLNTFLDRITKL